MKRSLPPLRLTRSPLVLVVTQVRFSAVVAIEKFIPEIQEQLRHKGFPRYGRGQIQELLLQPNAPPKFNMTDRFEFQNKEENIGIVLTPNSLAVHTNNYKNFEEFGEIVRTAIIVVNRVLQISLLERIGLRYVDLVQLKNGESLSEYLQPGLLGLDVTNLGVTNWMGRTEQSGKTQLGRLNVRCSQSEQILPPDLFPTSLKYSTSLHAGEIVTLLDFDHYVEQSADFDTRAVGDMIGELHDAVDLAFRSAVTKTALSRWGNGEAQ